MSVVCQYIVTVGNCGQGGLEAAVNECKNLSDIHWLRVPGRIRSKVAVYQVFHGCAPSHRPFIYVADLPSRRGLHSSCTDCFVQLALLAATASFSLRFTVPLLTAEHFRLLVLRCGTACHRRLRRHRLWRPSALDSRGSC